MTLLRSEQKPLLLTLSDVSGKLNYKTNEQDYTLERSGISQPSDDASELIAGFNGKWCDSLQALCFEIKLDGDSRGTLNYYQEREPFQESFRITYMDEYRIVIKIKDTKQAALELSDDKKTMTYESDSINETMIRQE